ncbi:hypothetical protein BDQ17DRAFT_1333446 [Cyathus striatus]|nr:hypothetical protein BDQ17DRAFT_1333446 [Cyathus striatus]
MSMIWGQNWQLRRGMLQSAKAEVKQEGILGKYFNYTTGYDQFPRAATATSHGVIGYATFGNCSNDSPLGAVKPGDTKIRYNQTAKRYNFPRVQLKGLGIVSLRASTER